MPFSLVRFFWASKRNEQERYQDKESNSLFGRAKNEQRKYQDKESNSLFGRAKEFNPTPSR
jgi:hypothetical protein